MDKYTGWREEKRGKMIYVWRSVLGMHGVRMGKMGLREKSGLV